MDEAKRWAIAAFVWAILVGCGGGDGTGEDREPVTELAFEAVVGQEAYECDRTFQSFGAGDDEVAITDFRLYLHDVEIVDAGGERRRAEFVDDDRWQLSEVALLDFTDGSGHCAHSPKERNETVELATDTENIESLSFLIGVPFELNHQDVATASSPLNLPAMFWNWNAGYKFARIDTEIEGGSSFRFHLGSTECLPGDDGGVEGCNHPNRARVEIENFDGEETRIGIDVAALFAETDVGEVTEHTAQGCTSAPEDPDCSALLERLGLDGVDGPVDDEIFYPLETGSHQ